MTRYIAAFVLLCSVAFGQTDASRQVVLEAARQEMISARVDELAERFAVLAQDLRSNPVGADAAATIVSIEERLTTLRDRTLTDARTALTKAARDPAAAPAQLAIARVAIDRAARELASLLLLAGASPAAETFARELRDIVEEHEAGSGQGGQRLAKLLKELEALAIADEDAVTAVRLTRARKHIEAGRSLEHLQAAEAARSDAEAFAVAQSQALQPLREAEARLRPAATLASLVRARDTLRTAQATLRTIRDQSAGADAGQQAVLARRQAAVLKSLQPLAGTAELQMLQKLASVEPDVADATIEQARATVQEQIEKIERLPAAYRELQAINERLRVAETFAGRQADLIDAADGAADAGKPLTAVADGEERLSRDLKLSTESMKLDETWQRTLQRQLVAAIPAVDRSASLLRSGPFAEASAQQMAALKELETVQQSVRSEQAYLEKAWTLLQLAGNLRDFASSLQDIEAEQRDLRMKLAAAPPEATVGRQQELLTKAVAEIRQATELVPEAAAMKPALVESERLMAESREKLQNDDLPGAAASHEQAELALQKARQVATETAARADYLADWAKEMEKINADAADLLQRQIALRKRTEPAEAAALPAIHGEQDVLRTETAVFGNLAVPSAAEAFKAAAGEMVSAVAKLKAADRDGGVRHQVEAEKHLTAAALELQKFLAGMVPAPAESLHQMDFGMDALTALLLLAVEEKELTGTTRLVPKREIPSLAATQEKLHTATVKLAASPVFAKTPALAGAVATIREGAAEMEKALQPLKQAGREQAVDHEQKAEQHLRAAFAQAVVAIYNALNAPPPPTAEAPAGAPMEGIPMTSYDSWSTFMKGQVGGADVNKDKAEWESLIDRQRAALHENFARELPLEYREMLKEYYEALSK